MGAKAPARTLGGAARARCPGTGRTNPTGGTAPGRVCACAGARGGKGRGRVRRRRVSGRGLLERGHFPPTVAEAGPAPGPCSQSAGPVVRESSGGPAPFSVGLRLRGAARPLPQPRGGSEGSCSVGAAVSAGRGGVCLSGPGEPGGSSPGCRARLLGTGRRRDRASGPLSAGGTGAWF